MDVIKKSFGSAFRKLGYMGALNWMDDELYLRLKSWSFTGVMPNFKCPHTFNEKLQWLKLHDRNPLYTKLVDKAEVKPWVAERIGWEHVVPTLGLWDSFDQIDFDTLPERFVLKCTHDSGGLAICRDRATFDVEAARRKIESSLSRNYFWGGREWPYKNVRPRVLAEEYLDAGPFGMIDNELICFGGHARCAFTCTGRAEGDLRVDFFDLDRNHLPFTRHYSNADVSSEAPANLKEMLALSQRLADSIPFVRVDFYEVAGELYFGEMTFSSGSGFERLDPEQWDDGLGSWIELPAGGWLLVGDLSTMWLHLERRSDVAPIGLTDYKFYCFSGEPRFLYVSQGLEDHSTARISFLNLDWTFAPFCREDYTPFEVLPDKPVSFGEMVGFARTLSDGIPFIRVDFYDVSGEPRFSEMTFHPCSGFMPFSPREWDLRIGDMLLLDGAYGPLGGQDDR